jgi:leucyl aminopeptidase
MIKKSMAMTALFKTDTQGIPITLIDTADFSAWLKAQPHRHQAWLNATHYQGDGLSLIPGGDGSLEAVIFGAKDSSQPLVCGDLPLLLPEGVYRLMADEAQQRTVAIAWGMGAYQFNRYKNPTQQLPTLALPTAALTETVLRYLDAITRVRDLINTPASDMMPEHLGRAVEDMAKPYNAQVVQWVGDELLEQNYPTIHAVGRASHHAPRLIDLRWGDSSHPKITLVGKGVCFDSGGLDVKGAVSMRLMKKDMGGAAQVMGLAQLIMAHQLPVRLRMLIPAVENAIAGDAYRPGDIITTRKGLTVEVENTDAEGRLVLCDALAEADSEAPELLLDFATLTGATTVALGHEMAGVFSAEDAMVQEIIRCGERLDDPVWQLPLYSPYKVFLKSDVADLVNCPKDGIAGGTIAALYLQAFVSEKTRWLHFDIMAWNSRKLPGRPLGGEASGIRAVFEYLLGRYGV